MASDDENEEFTSGVSGCVLLIDVSPPMWDQIEEETPLSVALKASISLIQKIMINDHKQLVGISLYGTKADENQGIENVIQLMPLREPSLDDLTKLKELSDNPDIIEETWKITSDFNLANALWQASRMFSSCKKKMGSQTATLLSCLKEPDANGHRVILIKAADVSALGISINLVNISNNKLPSNSFFKELGKVISDQPDYEWEPPEPVMDENDVIPLIWNNYSKKHAYAVLKFQLGTDVSMGVKLYHLCKKRVKPKKESLHRETNSLISSTTKMQIQVDHSDDGDRENDADNRMYANGSEDTPNTPSIRGQVAVLRSDITHYQEHGGIRIEFTDEEYNQLKLFAGPPGLKLLGFKPASVLNMAEWYLQTSAFLYPNEEDIEGSTLLFLALRDRCLAHDKIAICLLIARWGVHAKLVALVPQKRIMNGSRQVQPDGFHIIYLPYLDNLKEVPFDAPVNITIEQKQCMESIINKLKIRYSEDMFENPDLQTFYKALEALALGESEPQKPDDTTIPDWDEQRDRLGSLKDIFENVFGSMGSTAVKRSQNSEKANKKPANSASEDLDVDMIKNRIKNKLVEKFTIPQLKQVLKMANLPKSPALTGLKKEQLVQIIYSNGGDILSSL